MRLIDADALKKIWCDDCENKHLCEDGIPACYDVQQLNALPTIEAEPRWIPIEQDCPQRGKDVLISQNGVVSIDWLTVSEGVGYFFESGVAVQDIDAWMPLPEPYKEEHKNDWLSNSSEADKENKG